MTTKVNTIDPALITVDDDSWVVRYAGVIVPRDLALYAALPPHIPLLQRAVHKWWDTLSGHERLAILGRVAGN